LLEIDGVELNVALPAQPDRRGFQEAGICAAVGLMAIETILQNGRMLIKKRTSLLGVTRKAKLPVGKPLYELRRNSPVRVVATHATHFPLAQRMM
jgi:hypothetical protein